MNAFEETLKLPKPTIFFFFLFKEFYRIHENIWKLEEITADSTIKKKIAQLENRSGSRGSNLVCEAGARDRNESALAFLGVKKKGANEWTSLDAFRATFYFDLLVSRAVHAPQSRRITIVRAIAPRKCHNPSCSIDLSSKRRRSK